jgi:hypothetical protein
MPAGVALDVRSVVATVNNAAGADTTAELVIRDQSGAVIATHAQGSVIPAADTGTATFALRLTADNGSASGFIRYDVLNVGGWLNVRTTTNLNPDGGGITFEVEQSEFAVYLTDLVNGAFRVDTPFSIFVMNNGTFRVSNAALFDIDADAVVFGPSNSFTAQTANASINIDATEEVKINLANNQPLTVFDNSGNPIFRVDEDGDLHGLTGKALTFDL